MYRHIVITLVFMKLVIASVLDGDLTLTDGVKLVGIPVSNSLEEEGRSLGEDTPFFRMAKFLQGHELHVKLPYLVEKDKLSKIFAESLKAVDDNYKDGAVTGRGKDGGAGSMALLGMMFAKTLGAVGIGGLGLLTMKALAVSALALMLSAIVGVKKLASSHEDHDDHQVIYAGHGGHHRRKRDVDETPLPYRAWKQYTKNSH